MSRGKRGTQTHNVGFQFPTVYTYTLQYLLHFDYEAFGKVSNCHNEPKRALLTGMIHKSCKFNGTKKTWTFGHALTASLALEIAVDGTHTRIHKSTHLSRTQFFPVLLGPAFRTVLLLLSYVSKTIGYGERLRRSQRC
jgi:hypothetical protein